MRASSEGPDVATPFMLVSTFKVKDGSLENLRDYARRVTELMQAKEPRVIAFHCFLSEDRGEMSTRRAGSDIGIKPIHLAGFTRAGTA